MARGHEGVNNKLAKDFCLFVCRARCDCTEILKNMRPILSVIDFKRQIALKTALAEMIPRYYQNSPASYCSRVFTAL